MNKVITINLGGNAYQLEEGGYDLLRNYLDAAAARLHANPDRDEILSDIEGAMAEKFRALLGSHKTVVATKEVATVLAEMGPIEAEPGTSQPGTPGDVGATGAAAAESSNGKPRRLYRINEGAMLAGVCNGIAAYFNLDPTLVRLAFVLLTIFWGTGLLVYVVMAIVVPEACSPEEKAAAAGLPPTAQEFIRRAKAGYYEATKNFPDRKASREWGRRFRRKWRAYAGHWRHHWRDPWTGPAPVFDPRLSYWLPVLSLLVGMATVAWICTSISLLATGTVFGQTLPDNVPVWLAAALVFLTYGILVGPLKVARHLCYKSWGHPGAAGSLVFLLDAAIWFLVVGALLGLALHYFPTLREAVHNLPALAHQAIDDIRTWWNGK
jgi:phage shock protein PspC (stress-responsive transcriptional regulator)